MRSEVGAGALDLAVTTAAAQSTTRTVSIALADPDGSPMTTSSPAGSQVRAPSDAVHAARSTYSAVRCHSSPASARSRASSLGTFSLHSS